jgi:large subunit ribosomal protein L28
MAQKQCVITKKSSTVGNNVSHSNRKTKRRIYANLQKRRLFNPATGNYVTVTISAQGLRTLAKWEKAGRKYDLLKLLEQ